MTEYAVQVSTTTTAAKSFAQFQARVRRRPRCERCGARPSTCGTGRRVTCATCASYEQRLRRAASPRGPARAPNPRTARHRQRLDQHAQELAALARGLR